MKRILIIVLCMGCLGILSCNHVNTNKGDEATDLIGAIKNRNREQALELIPKSDLNKSDQHGQTALHWAAKRAMIQVVDQLINSGANLNSIDSIGFSAFDYARKTYRDDIVKLLLEHGASAYSSEKENFYDGPFVDLRPEGKYVYYLKNDSLKQRVMLDGKLLPDTCKSFHSWMGKDEVYSIKKSLIPDWKTETDQPIIVLGDTHGEYDRMIATLQECEVIDKDLKWKFKKGHLVYVGDVFDRGDQVTEILWFIYRLEQEAKKAGGKVHFVFGNHELMVLENDTRYIADKYEDLCKPLGLNYSALFHPNSVLGEWLRTRNSIIQINDFLFVHGGISEHLLEGGYTVEDVNRTTRQYILAGTNQNNYKACKHIFSSTGPFWYRGYFMKRSRYDKIKEEALNRVLKELQVKTIVVGHTEMDHISKFFDGKIIDVNIPMRENDLPLQALLIKDGKASVIGETEKNKK